MGLGLLHKHPCSFSFPFYHVLFHRLLLIHVVSSIGVYTFCFINRYLYILFFYPPRYQGSAHRFISLLLLHELTRRPHSDKQVEREGATLAAGLALGWVNLGRGAHAPGLSDLHLDECLLRLMDGGPDPFYNWGRPSSGATAPPHGVTGQAPDGQSTTAACAAAAAAMRGLFSSTAASSSAYVSAFSTWSSTFAHYQAQASHDPDGGEHATAAAERPSCIDDGGQLNVEMTAPGAILAVALMYKHPFSFTHAVSFIYIFIYIYILSFYKNHLTQK